MNRREYDRLLSLKANCEKCGGKGYQEAPREDGSFELLDCACVLEIERAQLLAAAQIPQQYRTWGFNQIRNDFVENNKRGLRTVYNYMNNLDRKIQSGAGLWFFSPPGLVKSSIICAILKAALDKGYKAQYTTASSLLNLKFATLGKDPYAVKQLENILENAHILAIEEIDKVRLVDNSSVQSNLFFDVLSDVYNENISLLISSNKMRDDVTRRFPSYIADRLGTVDSVPFIGRSGRAHKD